MDQVRARHSMPVVRRVPDPEPELSFGEALRVAVADRGVSLERLRRQLSDRGTPVSAATLSFWRSGRRQPEGAASLAAVDELEDLLGCRVGWLSDRLGPSRRPPPVGPHVTLGSLMALGSTVDDAMAELGLDGHGTHLDESTHCTLLFSGRSHVTLQVRTLTRALRDGVEARPVVCVARAGGEAAGVLKCLGGVDLGRQLLLADRGLMVSELRYDRPLGKGEATMIEYELRLPYASLTGTFFELNLTQRIGELVIWARFDPTDPPTEVSRYVDNGHERTEEIVDPAGLSSVLHLSRRVGPGKVGLSWTHPD